MLAGVGLRASSGMAASCAAPPIGATSLDVPVSRIVDPSGDNFFLFSPSVRAELVEAPFFFEGVEEKKSTSTSSGRTDLGRESKIGRASCRERVSENV